MQQALSGALDFETLEAVVRETSLRTGAAVLEHMINCCGDDILFPASKFFRAPPQMVSHLRQAELPPDNDRKFRRRELESARARSPSILADIGSIDHSFLFDRPVEDGAIAERVDCSGDPSGTAEDLYLGVI